MSFANFPDEIIIEIFECLLPKDLTVVSVCCRRFNAIAEPVLYSTFNQTGQLAIPQLLRTIIDNRQLKDYLPEYMKHLKVSDAFPRIDMSLLEHQIQTIWQENSNNDDDSDESDSEFESVPFDKSHWIHPAFTSDNWDHIVSMLLGVFSDSLRSFNIRTYRGIQKHVNIRKELRRAARRQLRGDEWDCLRRLRRVLIVCDDPEHWLNLAFLVPFLDIPSVTEVHVYGVADKIWPKQLVFHTTTLTLNSSALHPKDLKNFLLCFPNLKRFGYDHALARDEDFLPCSLSMGLANSRHCLEEIILSHSDMNWGASGDEIRPGIGSLTEFTSLKRMYVDSKILIGWEYLAFVGDDISPREYGQFHYTEEQAFEFASGLPYSLEALTIRSCTMAVYDCLPELFYLNQNLPPKLKTVTLEFDLRVELEEDDGVDWERIAWKDGVVLERYWSGEGIHKNYRYPNH